MTEDTEAPVSPVINGWWQVPLETGWGDLTLWVAQDRSATAERSRREQAGGIAAHTRAAATDGEPDTASGEPDASGSAEADRASSGDDSEKQLPDLRRCR